MSIRRGDGNAGETLVVRDAGHGAVAGVEGSVRVEVAIHTTGDAAVGSKGGSTRSRENSPRDERGDHGERESRLSVLLDPDTGVFLDAEMQGSSFRGKDDSKAARPG